MFSTTSCWQAVAQVPTAEEVVVKSQARAKDDAQEEVSTQSPAPSMEIDSTPPTAPEVDAAVPETRLLIIGVLGMGAQALLVLFFRDASNPTVCFVRAQGSRRCGRGCDSFGPGGSGSPG